MPILGKAFRFNRFEAIDFVFQVLGAPPAGPATGQAYFDSGTGKLKIKNATAFYDPTDRTTHTGTQPVSSITGFDAQVRTSRLDQMAVPTALVDFNNQRGINVGAPTNPTDLARLADVQALKTGMVQKDPVRVASTGPVNIAAAPSVIDGVTVAYGQRVLLKDQADQKENGVFLSNGGGQPLTRTAGTAAEMTSGAIFAVLEGDTNRDTAWQLTNDGTITPGTTLLTFQQFAKPFVPLAGAGINVSGSTISAALVSVFGRVGSVVAAAGDYVASQVNNDSSVAGATVAAALNALNSAIASAATNLANYVPTTRTISAGAGLSGGGDLTANRTLSANLVSVHGRVGAVVGALNDYAASLVANDSSVAGATVAAALNTLSGLIAGVSSGLANYVPTTRTVTAGAGLTGGGDLTTNRSLALDPAAVVPPARTVAAGAGLTGGGDLSTNRTIALDPAAVVPPARTITAGAGLTGGGDLSTNRSLALDPAVAVRKHAETLATSATTYTVTHNLNTLDVTVSVYLVATGEEVLVDVTHASVNTVTIGFAVAPVAGTYRVVVHG